MFPGRSMAWQKMLLCKDVGSMTTKPIAIILGGVVASRNIHLFGYVVPQVRQVSPGLCDKEIPISRQRCE